MSDGMRRELVYLSSYATNRYFIPNWGTTYSHQQHTIIQSFPSHFFANHTFSLYLCTRNIKSSFDLHQPSTTATVVKIRCGNKFNFKNKSL